MIYSLRWRFKLFLEPHALRDEGGIDTRLPQLPARAHGSPFVGTQLTAFIILAWEKSFGSHHRLPIMFVGICQRTDHQGDRCCC